jgi:hypothetical protein|nr:MAG TPA: General secretion pathway protein G polymer, bacterial secretion, cryo-EM [Caudoviricetes sp.]
MIELIIVVMVASYVAGIYVGRHWREFTQE